MSTPTASDPLSMTIHHGPLGSVIQWSGGNPRRVVSRPIASLTPELQAHLAALDQAGRDALAAQGPKTP